MLLAENVLGIQELIGRHPRPVGFVPTMGALHAGHTSLVERAAADNATVIVSIFVNPTQFTDPNDLVNYPRTPVRDFEMVKEAGCDLVFMPGVEEIYPDEKRDFFDFGRLEQVMEGFFRPGHFKGVAMVVSRLFDIIGPDKAYFGEKDFQQLAIIREMNRQQGNRVEIIGCPTIREPDGLAMSSRNIRLSPDERKNAGVIYDALTEVKQKLDAFPVEELKKLVTNKIESSGVFRLQYFEIVNSITLEPVQKVQENVSLRACIAVLAEHTRLIDNIAL